MLHPLGMYKGSPICRLFRLQIHLLGLCSLVFGLPSTTFRDGDLSLPLGLALGSPIVPSGCEGKLGVALESLQGLRDLT